MPLTPEQQARGQIDAALVEAGWIVQDRDEMNLAAGLGIAVREFRMAPGHGFADYMLFVGGQAAGVLEAKPVGYTLSSVELQADKYAAGLPAGLHPPVDPLPFLYVSTGVDTRFINGLDPDPKSRRISHLPHVHRPETLADWLGAETLDAWVKRLRLEAEGVYTAARRMRPSSLRARIQTLPEPEQDFLYPVTGGGGRERRMVTQARPPAFTGPDGDRLRQDDLRHHVDLPAHPLRRRAPGALPRRSEQPRRAGGEGVPGLPHAGRSPEVHRAVHCPAPDVEHHRRGQQGGRHHDPAPLLDAEGGAGLRGGG